MIYQITVDSTPEGNLANILLKEEDIDYIESNENSRNNNSHTIYLVREIKLTKQGPVKEIKIKSLTDIKVFGD